MSITIIIGLILLGVILVTIEFLVIPGITVAGIGGFILMIFANYLAYKNHGASVGNYTLLGTFLINIVVAVLVFRKSTWNHIGLQSEINGKANTEAEEIKIGDQGKAISRLAPIGKVMINNKLYEVSSQGGFIDEGEEIEVIYVKRSKIIVKQLV